MILRPDHQPIDEKADKASLCLMTDHRQGSLLQVLRAMEDSSINMTNTAIVADPERTVALYVPYRHGIRVDGRL